MLRISREVIYAAGDMLLTRAQNAGVARSDLTTDDVVRLLTGIASVGLTDEAQRDRLLGVALDGIRIQRPEDRTALSGALPRTA